MKILIILLLVFSDVCYADKISIYVSNPVGGISDVLARLIAKNQNEAVVVNMPGALTQQAMRHAFRNQQPLIVETSTLIIDPIIHGQDRTYDIKSNFKEIILLGSAPNVFMVHQSNPATNLTTFKHWVLTSNIDLTYATSGSMTQIAALEIMAHLGISGRGIPYKGGSNAVQAVMRNEVNFHVGNLVGARSALATKKVNNIMQKKEIFKTRGYYGIAFPNSMSIEMVGYWQRLILELFNNKDFRLELAGFGFDVDLIYGDQFPIWINRETVYYEGAIKRFNIVE